MKSQYTYELAEKVWKSHIKGMKLKDAAIKHGMPIRRVSDYVSRYLKERKGQLETK